MTTRYNLVVTSIGYGTIFSGKMDVDNITRVVQAVYLDSDLFTNILIPTSTGTPAGTYDMFTYYSMVSGSLLADNGYKSNWQQFDFYGLVINSMPGFPIPSANTYQAFNFFATNLGDETITNNGTVVAVDQNLAYTFLNASFFITPFIPPPCFALKNIYKFGLPQNCVISSNQTSSNIWASFNGPEGTLLLTLDHLVLVNGDIITAGDATTNRYYGDDICVNLLTDDGGFYMVNGVNVKTTLKQLPV